MAKSTGKPLHRTAGGAPLTAERVSLLRHRVAQGLYDDPRVIDAVARAVLRDGKIVGVSCFWHANGIAERRFRFHWERPGRITDC